MLATMFYTPQNSRSSLQVNSSREGLGKWLIKYLYRNNITPTSVVLTLSKFWLIAVFYYLVPFVWKGCMAFPGGLFCNGGIGLGLSLYLWSVPRVLLHA